MLRDGMCQWRPNTCDISNCLRFKTHLSNLVDDPMAGLHTSSLYTCCHMAEQMSRLHAVPFSDIGCNVDMHDPDKVYLHAMPDQQGQTDLRNYPTD